MRKAILEHVGKARLKRLNAHITSQDVGASRPRKLIQVAEKHEQPSDVSTSEQMQTHVEDQIEQRLTELELAIKHTKTMGKI